MLGWTVEVRDSSLVRVGQLSENDLTAFLAIPRMNSLGSWSIRLPNTVLNESGVRVPHELCAVLRTQGSGVIFTGPHGVVLTGPMTFAEMEATSDDPSGQWTIEGTSDLVEIAKSLAYPQPSNSSVSSQSVSNDVRSGLGEALMRAYVSSNIGPTASTARKVTDLTLAADGGLGISLSKSPRFQNLLELTQEIALGSDLLFDVVQVGSGREFRVSAPQDVSSLVRWDIANNQLSKSKYGYSAPGVTRVFVAGQGEGSERTIVEVTTAASLLSEAIWGRIERFVDQRNTDDISELTQAGLEVLATEGTTVTSLEVVPSSAMADGFGVDWFLGSWVTVVVNDQQIRAQVVEVPISITSSDGVLVGAVVGDATGFDWQAILAAKQSKTEKRVSALEANAEATALPKSANSAINGGFDIWQRGTNLSNPTSGTLTADRWVVQHNGSSVSRTISQQTFTPGAAPVAGYEGQYFYRYAISAIGSGNTYNLLINKNEDVRAFAGQLATYSFWAKADSARTLTFDLERNFGSGGSPQENLALVSSVVLSTAWSRYAVSVSVPSVAGKTIGAGSYLGVRVSMPVGVIQTIDIWGVQFEAGSAMTPFRRNANSVQAELAACQRFYQRMVVSSSSGILGQGITYGASGGEFYFPYRVSLRTNATAIDFPSAGSFRANIPGGGAATLTGINLFGGGSEGAHVQVTYSGALGSLGGGIQINANGVANAYLGFSAEL